MLLTIIQGPQSFEDLCTIDNIVYPTFQAVCLTRGLEDNQEWINCFTEAVLFSTSFTLRMLFVTALLHGEITDPLNIWLCFSTKLYNDLPHALSHRTDLLADLDSSYSDYSLYLIAKILMEHNKTLTDFRLPLSVYN